MIEALVVAGCYAALWSNAGAMGPIARLLIFAFLFLAAVIAILSKRVQRIAATPTELLLYTVGILSAVVSVVRSEDYSISYSIYFITIIIFISVLTRAISLERLLDLAALVVLLCIVTCVVFEGKSLIRALAISIGNNGLYRFGPLGNHPVLTGYIFGAGSILLIRRLYLSRNILERYVMAGGTLFAWAFILAASARSAVTGLLVSAVFAIVVEFRLLRTISFQRVGLATLAIAISALLYFRIANTYIQEILEINSSYRGIGSGATGRTELWLQGVHSLFMEPARLALGGGLRSSEYDLGFSTENSYITILLDSGLFVGSALILVLLYSPISALRVSRSSANGSNPLAFLASFFVLLLVQCFFLRYLVGLGNPTSLMTLVLLVSLSMRVRFRENSSTTSSDMTAPPSLADRLG
jgi:exopolysaccharide production protein ExoQ